MIYQYIIVCFVIPHYVTNGSIRHERYEILTGIRKINDYARVHADSPGSIRATSLANSQLEACVVVSKVNPIWLLLQASVFFSSHAPLVQLQAGSGHMNISKSNNIEFTQVVIPK
jgi:hypothetical protein